VIPRIAPTVYSEAAFAPILAEAERAGGGFMLRVREEWLSGVQRFDRPGEFLLGCHVGDMLAGVGGVSHDPYDPLPGLGRVRHIYVLERLRRQGIGRALMEAIVARAANSFDVLRLRTRSPEAAALYESLGFLPSSGEHETHRLTLRGASVA
jgi:GNAT superfamily N-acetyltransferase